LLSTYSSNPTRFQIICFGSAVNNAVQNNTNKLQTLFDYGLSPNPYDIDGRQFLAHIVATNGNLDAMKLMIEFGGSDIARCLDGFGRTPLHCLCWNFETIPLQVSLEMAKILLQCDPQMIHRKDCSDREPFSYVPRSQHSQWMSFLNTIKPIIWPSKSPDCSSNIPPIRQPKRNPTVEIVKMLSSGRMEPTDVEKLFFCDPSREISVRTNNQEMTKVYVMNDLNCLLLSSLINNSGFDDSCSTFLSCDELVEVLETISYDTILGCNQNATK
jgi:Ankyrin repeats (3 copies)